MISDSDLLREAISETVHQTGEQAEGFLTPYSSSSLPILTTLPSPLGIQRTTSRTNKSQVEMRISGISEQSVLSRIHEQKVTYLLMRADVYRQSASWTGRAIFWHTSTGMMTITE